MPQASSSSTEYIVVNDVAVVSTQALEPLQMPRTLRQAAKMIILGSLAALPLAFGAVHPSVYLIAHMAIYALLLALIVGARPFLRASLLQANFSAKLVTLLLAFVLYCVLQTLILAYARRPHPVLGLASAWPNLHAALTSLDATFFFLATFITVRMWLGSSERQARFLVWVLISLSLLVSLVALSHWFYDNGKLFWTFEPENTFVSPRARWPFVNPNNLAHFLLPAFFLIAAKLGSLFAATRQIIQSAGQRKLLAQAVSNRRLQSNILQSIFTACAMLCVSLCIAGSLSRSAWLGLSVGIVVYGWRSFGLQRKSVKTPVPETADSLNLSRAALVGGGEKSAAISKAPPEPEVSEQAIEAAIQAEIPARHAARHGHRRHHREPKGEGLQGWDYLGLAARPLLLGLAVGLFYFFLQGRGSELIEERIDYGLAYTKDDMRWQLYADTLPMIEDHWLMGVGLGSWASYYPKYKNRLLSGMNPVHLHSDPLQLLAETGLAGALFLICGAGLIIYYFRKALAQLSAPQRILTRGIGIGLFSLGLASALEFPFRIPAIVFYAATYLALMAVSLDKSQNNVPL